MNEMLYKQLENNIVEQFKPPEYSIANRFHVDGWSFKEMTEILNRCESLSQVYKVRIQNAYQDISVGYGKKNSEDYPLWNNEQLHTLKMQKRRL